jgi:signal transduction histidine kinase/CHASE3 domain sensor protein
MNFKSLLNKSNLIKSIFVGSLFVLIFISAITYKHSVSITESTNLLIHTQKVRVELEQLNSSLKNVEMNQTSYFISRDSIFLNAFNESRYKVSESINELQSLTHDNLKQQNNLDTLVKLIRLRYNILFENAINLNDSIHVNAKRFNKSLLEGKEVMTTIRNQINDMIDLEGIYLKEQQKHYENETFFTPLYSLLMLMFSLIVFIISYYKINRDLETLKKANLILKISTETMNHAEEIGAFSSWQWDLDNNSLMYSENHHKLLGVETKNFDPTIDHFLDFVHPDDRHIIISGEKRVIEQNQSTVAFFRVIRKDGNLRYFKSTGKFLTGSSGNKILIGINMDVTEEYLVSKSLEDRNSELEKSNKELASFNHVASHDLQEPLRKIQTFISRIFEKEATNLSNQGKDYLERIQISAKRMRVLIDDLLLFSRTNRVEKVYESTNLNILLDVIMQELTEQIEEKKAQIDATILPTLVVIPFQIQQLFINLISNSLKYSKESVPPVISITCEKINSSNYKELIKEKNTQYYKISIFDNGLGFKDEYKEDIFTLFYRLHNNSDYPGTGIGLAICKKIIENHKGYITAESILGEGSTFHIFLPVNLNQR